MQASGERFQYGVRDACSTRNALMNSPRWIILNYLQNRESNKGPNLELDI